MNTEHSDLEAAKAGAKSIAEGAAVLAGLALKKGKQLGQTAKAALKRAPKSLQQQATETIEAEKALEVRNHKIGQVAFRLSIRYVRAGVTGVLSAVWGASKGLAGYIDKTTKNLAQQRSDEAEEASAEEEEEEEEAPREAQPSGSLNTK